MNYCSLRFLIKKYPPIAVKLAKETITIIAVVLFESAFPKILLIEFDFGVT